MPYRSFVGSLYINQAYHISKEHFPSAAEKLPDFPYLHQNTTRIKKKKNAEICSTGVKGEREQKAVGEKSLIIKQLCTTNEPH